MPRHKVDQADSLGAQVGSKVTQYCNYFSLAKSISKSITLVTKRVFNLKSLVIGVSNSKSKRMSSMS